MGTEQGTLGKDLGLAGTQRCFRVPLPGGSPVHPFVHPFAMYQSSVHSWRSSATSSTSHAWYFGSASSSQEERSVVGLPPAQNCICFSRDAQLAHGPEPRLNDPALPTRLLHSDGPSDLEEAWEGRAWLQGSESQGYAWKACREPSSLTILASLCQVCRYLFPTV